MLRFHCSRAARRTARRVTCLMALGWVGCVGHVHADGEERVPASAFQSHASINAGVRDYLLARVPEVQRADARVELGRLDPRLRLPECGSPLQMFTNGDRPAAGAQSVGVRCAGERPWTLYVPARVAVFGPVAVIARPLARGATIQRQDMEIVRRDLAGLSHGYFDTPEAAIGKMAKQPLSAGQILQAKQVVSPKLVRRGEQVTLRVSADGFEVSVAGSALADGELGQRIRVRNERSQRVVEGEVVAAGAVRVSI
jgi:flagella basal body P-ring formation protein FlgA